MYVSTVLSTTSLRGPPVSLVLSDIHHQWATLPVNSVTLRVWDVQAQQLHVWNVLSTTNLQEHYVLHADRIDLVLETTTPVEIVMYRVVSVTTLPPSVPVARPIMSLRGLGLVRSVLSGSSVQLEIIHALLVIFHAWVVTP